MRGKLRLFQRRVASFSFGSFARLFSLDISDHSRVPEPRRAHLVIEASAAVSMPIHERKGCTYILISHRRSERLLARARPDLFAAGVHRTPPTGSHSWRRACCLVRCRVSLRTSWVFCATAFGNAPQESVTKKGKLALPGVSH